MEYRCLRKHKIWVRRNPREKKSGFLFSVDNDVSGRVLCFVRPFGQTSANLSASHTERDGVWSRIITMKEQLCKDSVAAMFARKIQVEILEPEAPRACPVAWLDSFCMRSFTGRSAFDDLLPIADGLMEAGSRVEIG